MSSGDKKEQDEPNTNSGTPRVNPFASFAYKPPTNTQGVIPSPKALGKRKRLHEETRKPGGEQKIKSESLTSTGSRSKITRTYDHLAELQDNLEDNLDLVFCGINPGVQSAQIGHHFGNPNNHFWSCLHESGLTTRRLNPREDHTLPRQFSIGLTNLVRRPTAESELTKAEQIEGVSKLLEKITRYRPRVVCFVGLGIADIIKSQILDANTPRRKTNKAMVGLQPYKLVHAQFQGDSTETLFFAVSSTSGRVVHYQKSDKIQQFKDLRSLMEKLKNNTFDSTPLTPIAIPPPVPTSSIPT